MILLTLGVMLLPGLAWWSWLGKREQDPLVSLAQVIGISLSVIILLAQAVFLLGGSFSLAGILVFLAGSAAIAVGGRVRSGPRLARQYWPHLTIGLVLVGLVFVWRLYQAKELLLPNWVDSQHHYLIIRVILEQGGLPATLLPYLPGPFYYHYGYHAVTALFTALAGLEIGEAMLLFGQLLNALVGLSIYTLGKALWEDWRPATAAALLVSFVTRMPAYYLSWGRYTLLTGLVLMPLAMGITLNLLRKPCRKRDIATLGVLTAGVLLTHYFTALLLAAFIIFVGITFLFSHAGDCFSALKRLGAVAAGAVSGLLLATPWLWRVVTFSPSRAGVNLNLPESIETVFTSGGGAYIWQLLSPTSNHWLLLLAGIGLLVGLVKLKVTGFGLWSLALGVLTLPWTITLRPFRPDHFAIVLFLPVSLWAGWLLWQVGHWVGQRLRRRWVTTMLMALMVAGWIAWGVHLGADIINPVTVLVTEDDLDALDWVAENTPEEARFFINTAYWLNNVYRGVDGGGWLLPYTGRWSLVPTVFYGFSPELERTRQLREWGERASAVSTCADEFWELVTEAEVDWVYLREDVGSLQTEGLEGCEGIRRAFANETVHIYQIIDE